MEETQLQLFLDFALEAAWEAGRVTLGYFQTNLLVELKADASPVTEADRRAEQVVRELVNRFWPDHGVIGEEFGQERPDAEFVWVVDPIDGTKSFITGVPLFGTLLALLHNQEPVVGVLYFPALNELVYAARHSGCFWNGRRARVSGVQELAQAKLVTSGLNSFAPQGKAKAWERLVGATAIQRTWGDAYGYALVATGRADIMVDPIMEVWDAAAVQVVVEEAGGTFTDWQGRPTISSREGIATNGALLEPVLALIRTSG